MKTIYQLPALSGVPDLSFDLLELWDDDLQRSVHISLSTLSQYIMTQVTLADSPNLDGFNRLRISEPRPLGDYQLQYDLDPIQLEAKVTNSGVVVFDKNTRMGVLSSVGSGVCRLQSYNYHPYQAGRSHAVVATCVFGAASADCTKRIGYFDDNNGIYMKQDDNGDFAFVLRSSTSGTVQEETVYADSWSENPNWSIDATKSFILAMDLQFLGMGRVRIYEDRDGVFTPLHFFENEQNKSEPYMQTATLPIRAEIESTGGNGQFRFKCASVMTEGGVDDAAGFSFARTGPDQSLTSSTNWIHLFSIRPLSSFNGITNRTQVIPTSIDILAGTNTVEWIACVGSSYSVEPTWANQDGTYSGVSYGINGVLTDVTAPGVRVAGGFASGGSATSKGSLSREISTKFPITLDSTGLSRAMGTLSVFARHTGNNTTARGGMNWREIR